MISTIRHRVWLASLVVVVGSGISVAWADEPVRPDDETARSTEKSVKSPRSTRSSATAAPLPGVSLFDAVKTGAVSVDAEGTGDGNMAIVVTNNTNRKLRVVLPPGLVASGATGQFGGMGGMGGGGMGGMGGGMGGMGGGMRSIPPTDLPNATINPGQSRDLSTRYVSLNAPDAEGAVSFPAKGEPLTIGDVAQLGASAKVQAALRRLARDKAPENISQMVLWAVGGMGWDDIALISRSWANAQELALAKQLVADLDADASKGDTGRLLIEVTAKDESRKGMAGELANLFARRTVLGLLVESKVPVRPTGPAVGVKVQLVGTSEKPEASVQLATTDGSGTSWTAVGKFTLPVLLDATGKVKSEEFGDALAEQLLKRLVVVKLVKTKANSDGALIPSSPKAKDTYAIRVENYSPLLLNGVAVTGSSAKPSEPAKLLVGISLAPRRTFSVPATSESVERFGLKDGIKVLALDLSGL